MKFPASNAIGLAMAFSAAAVTLALTWTGCRPPESPPPREASSPVSECAIQLRDVTAETGIAFVHTDGSSGQRYIPETVTAGLASFDYNGDGFVDVYFLNGAPLRGAETDGPPPRNALYRNEGGWRFTDVTDEAGVGDTGFGLGATVGDYDNDVWLDLFMTSYQGQMPVLYKNLAGGGFKDVTSATGVGDGSFPHVNWGNGLVDFDNDGDRDIFIACGHLQDNIHLFDDTSAYHVRNILLMNTGDGKFVNVSDAAGDGLLPELSSRGAAFDDLDNDGDGDAVILNSRSGPTILRNDSRSGNHWIQLRLRGVNTNRDGVGAQVTVVAGDLTQVDEVHSGRGYQSHWGTRIHFGLGKRDRVDLIEVRWIGGGVNVLRDVEVDRLLTITEGSNQAAAVADTRCVARTSPRKRFLRPVPPLSPPP